MKLALVLAVCCLALADAQFWKGGGSGFGKKGGGRFATFGDKSTSPPETPADTDTDKSSRFSFGGKGSRFGTSDKATSRFGGKGKAEKSESPFMSKFGSFWSLFGARSGAKGYGGVALSKWNRTVGGVTTKEMAFVDKNRSTIIVRTDEATMYDFGGEDVMAAVRIGWTCYVIPADVNGTYFEEAANDVFERNGTSLGAPSEVLELDAVTAPAFNITSPALAQFCQGRTAVEPVIALAGTFPAEGSTGFGQRVKTVSTFNTQLRILDRTPWSRWIPSTWKKG